MSVLGRVMSVLGRVKLTVCLWPLRNAAKVARCLVMAAAAAVVWPVTVVTAVGYASAWLRGWPPVRLYRAAAWSLLVSMAWLAALMVSMPGWLAARTPGRTWAADWDRLDAAGLARVFLLLAPVALPAGLALAGLTWAIRSEARSPSGARPGQPPATPSGARLGQPLAAAWRLSARIRHGRPRRLLVRGLIASVLSLVVMQLIPGTPASPADITGLILWFALAGWKDLAPRPDAERRAGDNGRYAPGNRDRRVPAGL